MREFESLKGVPRGVLEVHGVTEGGCPEFQRYIFSSQIGLLSFTSILERVHCFL